MIKRLASLILRFRGSPIAGAFFCCPIILILTPTLTMRPIMRATYPLTPLFLLATICLLPLSWHLYNLSFRFSTMEEDPNLVLTLKAITTRAADAFRLPHNQNRYVPPSAEAAADIWSRESTPATIVGDDERGDFSHRDFSHQIQLTFDEDNQGYTFGKDNQGCTFGVSRRCDVVLERLKHGESSRISSRHFRITFDDQGRLKLEAMSKSHSMTVSQDGQAWDQPRKHYFKWILFPGTVIKVIIDETLEFWIELAKHDSCQDEYQKRVQSFLETSRNAIALNLLNIDSQQTTAAPSQPLSPSSLRQAPIYRRLEELGRGKFGKVYKVIDVSTGDTYAGKYFYPDTEDKWKSEVEILKKVSHVSMTVSQQKTIL